MKLEPVGSKLRQQNTRVLRRTRAYDYDIALDVILHYRINGHFRERLSLSLNPIRQLSMLTWMSAVEGRTVAVAMAHRNRYFVLTAIVLFTGCVPMTLMAGTCKIAF